MLCLVTLTSAVVGSWTYAGFVADPPRPSPAATRVESAPAPRRDLAVARELPPSAPPARPVRPVPAGPAPRYRLADVSGQVWEHTDSTWLETFVAGRNQQFLGLTTIPTACRTGNCR